MRFTEHELLTLRGRFSSYSMKPSSLNLFMKKFTRERGADHFGHVSCDTLGTTRTGMSRLP